MKFSTYHPGNMNGSRPLNADGSFGSTCKIALAVGYSPCGVTKFMVHNHLGFSTAPGYFSHLWSTLRLNGVIAWNKKTKRWVRGPRFVDYHTHLHRELDRISRKVLV